GLSREGGAAAATYFFLPPRPLVTDWNLALSETGVGYDSHPFCGLLPSATLSPSSWNVPPRTPLLSCCNGTGFEDIATRSPTCWKLPPVNLLRLKSFGPLDNFCLSP